MALTMMERGGYSLNMLQDAWQLRLLMKSLNNNRCYFFLNVFLLVLH